MIYPEGERGGGEPSSPPRSQGGGAKHRWQLGWGSTPRAEVNEREEPGATAAAAVSPYGHASGGGSGGDRRMPASCPAFGVAEPPLLLGCQKSPEMQG